MDPTPGNIAAIAVEKAVDSRGRFGSVLDLRSHDQVVRGHLPGCAWLPASALGGRGLPSHLLPPRGETVILAGDSAEQARLAGEDLQTRGWNALALADGWQRRATARGKPTGRLWRPDGFVQRISARLPPPETGPVLDLGGGNGRNGVFLAQRGYDVLIVDRLADTLELAEQRARHHDVDVRLLQRDLRAPDDLPAGPFAIVLMIRFLSRELLPGLGARVCPGGAILLRAFAAPGTPRPRRHELRVEDVVPLFPSPPWQLVHGPALEQETEGTRHRTLVEAMLERRPATAAPGSQSPTVT